MNNNVLRTVVFWAVIVVSAFLLWQVVKSGSSAQAVPEISYSDFLTRVAGGQVSEVRIAGSVVRGTDTKGNGFRIVAPANQAAMLDALQQHGVAIWFKETSDQTWPNWILNLAPLILLGALWFFMIRQVRGRRSSGDGPPGFPPPQETKPGFGP
ncbi:MAG: ATP-dependent metallopeptidase FtsH/Yme1/Tma family protein [Terriglobales bacterium]|jgi:cell division protease FtsH